jgi:hypothetical protein
MPFEKIYDYSDAPTIKRFSESDKFFRLLMGPFGSGKSSGCVAEIISRGIDQAPNKQGVRRTRWSVVRNTYRQLFDTTMKTFFEWLPPDQFGNFNITNHQYIIDKIALSDGTRVEIEVLFRALDKPEDVRNVLSLEITGSWINEAREIPKAIVDGIEDRTGRYPPESDEGCTWRGVIADTNPPDVDSWIYRLFEEAVERDPEIAGKYEIFKQPSGRSDKAENLRYLRKDYYKVMAIGKDPEYVKVYVDGQYGYTRDGKPVWHNYSDVIHVAPGEIKPIVGMPLVIAFDFGMHNAAVIGQPTFRGGMNILHEFYEPDAGLRRFLRDVVKPVLFSKYRGHELVTTGDPSGTKRQDNDERSCYLELHDQGFPVTPAPSNSWLPRYNAVDSYLTKLIDGKAAFQLSPTCKILRKGFINEYKLKRIGNVFGSDKFSELPAKNDFSHVQDCVQYICMVSDRGLNSARGYDLIGARYTPPTNARRPSIPQMAAWT